MRCLVTGGAGFIGSHIVEELVRRRDFVRVLDNFSTGFEKNIESVNERIEVIEGDVRDMDVVKEATKDIDVVMHHAAQIFVQKSIENPAETHEVNVTGTLNLLEASKENSVKKFIFASSAAVYGDSPELPKKENMKTSPISPYAVSKLFGEEYCRLYSSLYGLNTLIFRYFNVFGPRQNPNSEYSGVISKFIQAISENITPEIYGDGTQTRDFTYVSDIVKANITAAITETKPGVTLNAACMRETDLNYIVNQLNKILGKEVKPVFKDFKKGDIKKSFADITEIKEMIKWHPDIGIEEGLMKTTSNYKQI